MPKSIKLKNDIYWDASNVLMSVSGTGESAVLTTLADVTPTNTYSASSTQMMTGVAVYKAIDDRLKELGVR